MRSCRILLNNKKYFLQAYILKSGLIHDYIAMATALEVWERKQKMKLNIDKCMVLTVMLKITQ